MFYREWCLKPQHRRGTMLPVRQIETMLKASNPGYASVYMFDEPSAMQILESRSSADLSRFLVYTSELVLDLDGGGRQREKAESKLRERGLGYEVWASGGKGYHIYIPLTRLVSGRDVPYSQRKWAEALHIDADVSLYQHGRIISLPGRVHPKTGARKRLTHTVSGRALDLPLLVAPEPVFNFGGGGDLDDLEIGLWGLLNSLSYEPPIGGRHTKLWTIALSLADAGLSYDTTLELLQEVNGRWENPKAETEIEMAAKQAYRQSGKSRRTT